MEFSETIKFIRRKSLLSQKDFAKALGVSFSTVNRWENDRAIPKICKLKLIKDYQSKFTSEPKEKQMNATMTVSPLAMELLWFPFGTAYHLRSVKIS